MFILHVAWTSWLELMLYVISLIPQLQVGKNSNEINCRLKGYLNHSIILVLHIVMSIAAAMHILSQ